MSFNILDPNTSIKKRCTLEASAGTGKTFTIEHLFFRLILEEKIPLEKILVVTFTKKATRELKQRIFQTLKKGLLFFQSQEKTSLGFPYLTKEIPLEELEKKLSLIKEAIQYFEKASIFTIHSFCQRMLQEFSFEARISFFLKEKKRSSASLFSSFQNFLKNLQSEVFSPFEMKVLLKHTSYSLSALFSWVIRLLETKEEKKVLSLKQIHEKILKNLFSLPCEKKQEWMQDLEKAFLFHKRTGFCLDSLQKEGKKIWEILQKKGLSFEDFLDFLSLSPSLFPFLHPSNQKRQKIKEFSWEALSSYPIFSWLENHFYPLLQQALSFPRCLQRLSHLFYPTYLSLIEEGEVFSFSHEMKTMEKALPFPSFSKSIQKKYEAAIIDEFQDTDPLQWKILSHLFQSCPTFYLVADPKQSIYGFRKADIYTYLQAKETLKNSLKLEVNYRSSPELVKALNHLFSGISQKPWMALPKKENFLPYHPVKSGSLFPEIGETPLCFFVIDQENHPSLTEKEAEKQFFFPFIAETIKKEENSSDRIAILVKDRFQARSLQKYLQERGIFFSTRSHESLGKTLAFSALKIFMEAIFSPSFSSIQTALLTPFCNWSLQDLSDHDLPYEIFFSLQEKMKGGLSFFLSSFMKSIFSLEKNTVEELCYLQKDSFYEDLFQIFDLLLSSFEQEKISKEKLFSFFSKMEEELEEDEKGKRRFFGSEKRVIMTMHKSKGLEFEIVFALGVVSKIAKKDPFLEEEEELDAEKLRQFYVALTRAKKKVFVPFILDPQKVLIPGKTSPVDIFFSYLFYQKPYQNVEKVTWLSFIEKFSSLFFLEPLTIEKIDLVPSEKKIEEKTPLLPSLKKGNSLFSFSSLSQGANLPRGSKEPFLFPRGPTLGNFIHEILQDFLEDRSLEKMKQKIFYSEYTLFASPILLILEKAFHTPLFPKGFSLYEVPPSHIWPETPFLFSLQTKSQVKGFIDLLFLFQGKYYLLDWKTNDLGDKKEDYSLENLEKEMIQEDYFFQASLYRKALERFFVEQNLPFSFGGMFYIFLRGLFFEKGIYHFYPDKHLATKRLKEE